MRCAAALDMEICTCIRNVVDISHNVKISLTYYLLVKNFQNVPRVIEAPALAVLVAQGYPLFFLSYTHYRD